MISIHRMTLTLICAWSGFATGCSSSDAATTVSESDDGGATIPLPTGDAGISVTPTDTLVRVHYPNGGHTIALRGDTPPLASDHGTPMKAVDSNVVELHVPLASGVTSLSFKPYLDDGAESRGPSYVVPAGTTIDVFPHFSNRQGQVVQVLSPFHSTTLEADPQNNDQIVWAYLPPSYDENPLLRYPVVYMHDGQNLWVDAHSTTGIAWHADTEMDSAIEAGTMDEVIVIAPEHGPVRQRIYAPVSDPGYPQSSPANGSLYAKMVATELKPAVDAKLRTLPDRANTAALGSSLGGLMTAYEGVLYPDTFGLLGEMSPSAWWHNDWIVFQVDAQPASTPLARIYVDQGTSETTLNAGMLAREYELHGYTLDQNLKYYEEDGAQHDEAAWGRRLPTAFAYLFSPSREAIVTPTK